jgi:signal transduction histidine kinase
LSSKNREIEQALVRGQRIERKRVASELHDNLNTKVAAFRWHLEAMNTDGFDTQNQKIHDRLLQMSDDVYADIRLISHNLLPSELETQGLSSALYKLVDKLNVGTKTAFTLVKDGEGERPSSVVEYQLYNVALELVNNVIKHAKATQAWISLTQTPRKMLLTVSDNGVGFSSEHQSEGIGMRNIQARVEELSGKISIESRPEHGTKVAVEVPIA